MIGHTGSKRYAQVQFKLMIIIISQLAERHKEASRPNRPEHQLVVSPHGSLLVRLGFIAVPVRAATVPRSSTKDDASAGPRAPRREESQWGFTPLFLTGSSGAADPFQSRPPSTEYSQFDEGRSEDKREGGDASSFALVDVGDLDTQEDITPEETSLAADGTRKVSRTHVTMSRRRRQGEAIDSLSSSSSSLTRVNLALPTALFLFGIGFAVVFSYAGSPPFSPLGSAFAAVYAVYLGLIGAALTLSRWGDDTVDAVVVGYSMALIMLAYTYALHARGGLAPYFFLGPPLFFLVLFARRVGRRSTQR